MSVTGRPKRESSLGEEGAQRLEGGSFSAPGPDDWPAVFAPQPWQAGVLRGPAWSGLRILVTSREGGASQEPYASFNLGSHVGDDPAAVSANRQRLRSCLPADPCWLDQVHGVAVHHADLATPGDGASVPQADAAVTRRPGQVLAILTADCLPVVVADAQAGVLAVAHAGWRGLADGVLEATVAAMRARADGPLALRAWIGPAIGPEAFEVGDDVRDVMGVASAFAFKPRAGVPGKWWCNLPALASWRLQAAGVAVVSGSGACTVADRHWYSYRRDGRTGRFATLAWWNPEDETVF